MTKEELEYFAKPLRTAGYSLVGLGAWMLLFGGAMSFLPSDEEEWIRVAVVAFFAAMGVYLVWVGWRLPRNSAGMRLLLERPSDVVWISPTRIEVNGNVATILFSLNTVNGESHKVRVAARHELVAEEILTKRCPKAYFGFSREWEAAFKANPASLRRG